jgi:hypothetical protein
MAAKANIVIDQGADFQTTIIITDDNEQIVDLSGFTGFAQMRKYYTSSTSYNFDVTIAAANGAVTIAMSANTSNNINSGRYVYDCELMAPNNKRSRIVEGIVTVTPQVTR